MKARYGEVETPFSLVQQMIGQIEDVGGDQWLEAGAGRGAITLPLLAYAKTVGRSPRITAVEIQEKNCEYLAAKVDDTVTVVNQDFVAWSSKIGYDLIIGNPPFNSRGLKKVPTNSKSVKKGEGITIWPAFVKKALSLLKPGGLLVYLTPCIWLKPDKAGIYEALTRGSELKVRCFSASETMRLFRGEAQTPMVLFSYRSSTKPSIAVYDDASETYVQYQRTTPNGAIPMKNIRVVNKLQAGIRKHGNMDIVKSKNTRDLTQLKQEKSAEHVYPSVKTAVLDGKDCKFVVEWSREKMPYTGVSKLILAHKMYGFPYLDVAGEFGIARRDIYLVVSDDLSYLEKCREILCSKIAFQMFESTRYRMRFLERYAFEFLPRSVGNTERQEGYTFNYKN